MMILIYFLGGSLLVVVLAALAILLSQVEDWNRDLSINWASTSDNSPDQRLQNIESDKPRAELVATVKEAAASLKNWQFVEEQGGSGAAKMGVTELHLVRSTKLMRFKDDVHVKLTTGEEGKTIISAESRSRVGKGDLGQNPRNLRELFAAIRARL